MTIRKTFEAIIDTRTVTRDNRDYTTFLRFAKREGEAEEQIGALIRDGKTVYYVWPAGGRYREGSRRDLINYLVRNQYA